MVRRIIIGMLLLLLLSVGAFQVLRSVPIGTKQLVFSERLRLERGRYLVPRRLEFVGFLAGETPRWRVDTTLNSGGYLFKDIDLGEQVVELEIGLASVNANFEGPNHQERLLLVRLDDRVQEVSIPLEQEVEIIGASPAAGARNIGGLDFAFYSRDQKALLLIFRTSHAIVLSVSQIENLALQRIIALPFERNEALEELSIVFSDITLTSANVSELCAHRTKTYFSFVAAFGQGQCCNNDGSVGEC